MGNHKKLVVKSGAKSTVIRTTRVKGSHSDIRHTVHIDNKLKSNRSRLNEWNWLVRRAGISKQAMNKNVTAPNSVHVMDHVYRLHYTGLYALM
jgi:hypothetical protein